MARNSLTIDKYRGIMSLRYHLLISVPLLYLYFVYVMQRRPAPVNSRPVLTYLLIALALGLLPTIVMVKQRMLSSLRRTGSGRNARASIGTFYILWMALAEVCYLLGLVAYLVTRDHQQLYYFYPIGIIASIIVWPTRERFDALVAQLEEK